MNRNENSRFVLNPTNLDIQRSKFPITNSVKTTLNVGDLVPFYCQEVLPGDTFNVKSSKVIRMPSLLTPFMDNLYIDYYYFFVPNRLVWDHWRQFLGENDKTSWIPDVEYEVPTVTFAEGTPSTTGVIIGSLADYFGLPTYVPGISVSVLPFRAYALIYNEWFRDENLCDPLVINKGDESVSVGEGFDVSYSTPELEAVQYGLKVCKVSKYHDYFTSALPSPQKGPDVTLPIANVARVVADNELSAGFADMFPNGTDSLHMSFYNSSAGRVDDVYGRLTSASGTGTLAEGDVFADTSGGGLAGGTAGAFPTNLVALLDQATGATVNELRMAFQLQKFYERLARGGSRYTELIRSFFGVTPPDATLQRPEYLGGNRVPIHVNQVIQQSATDSMTPQGNVAGMSLTTDQHSDFIKSFTEHGYVIGVCCVRYDHTYQQGIERHWSRRSKFDFYFPVFANLGEQPILNKEIFAQGNAQDDEVFAYSEAWSEYRFKPSYVTGLMRSQVELPEEPGSSGYQSIDSWHLADYYSSLPRLSKAWIEEDKSVVDRVLAVSEKTAGFQVFMDMYIQNMATRPMPLYSIPGLIDHH